MDIKTKLEEVFPKIIDARRHLHQHPELSEQESETEKFICDFLDNYDIHYHNNIAGHGVVAQIGSGNRAFAIRADIDALPIQEKNQLSYASVNDGVMHACGHDMHTAILLGAGLLLKEYEQQISEKDGCIKLLFQPSEETVGGAAPMISEGVLENPKVEGITALHMDPMYPSGAIVIKHGPMNAGTATFTITVKGVSAHGAHPENGVDAIVVASNVVTALQTISSRFNSPTTPVIVSIGCFEAGKAPNIVADTAILKGTSRGLDFETIDSIKEKIEQISKGICSSYGASCEIQWGDDSYPPLVNDDDINKLLEESTEELFGKSALTYMPEPSLGADDFAFFTQKIKGAYFNLGSMRPNEEFHPLHSELFNPDEDAMKRGIAIESMCALKFFEVI